MRKLVHETRAFHEADIRRLYPGTRTYTYLDNAAVGLVSTNVCDAMATITEAHRDFGVAAANSWGPLFADVRTRAARLVSGSSSRIALTQNTSTGIALVANGVNWNEGDNIVLPTGEFPSNSYPWHMLRNRGVQIRSVPMTNGHVDLPALLEAVDSRTRVVTMSAVQYSSGYRYPLEEIGGALRSHSALFVVDGTQAVGAMRIDVNAAYIDVLAVSAHKWMLGPFGIGFVHLSDNAFDALRPSTTGWMSVKDPFAFTAEPELADDGRRFESGTEIAAGVAGLGATLDLVETIGAEQVESIVLDRVALLRDMLKTRGFRLLFDYPPARRSGIVLAVSEREESATVHQRLLREQVLCSLRGGGIRFSPHYFTSDGDLEHASKVASR
ncbi:MAG: aminotransferase class V-fold PLP-dependent enzyme [Comamonadaceae bacterium]|nr:MAG: aminotransferase class V-fold PLP-dependent enzyme [Comamonadaceae bacterium]